MWHIFHHFPEGTRVHSSHEGIHCLKEGCRSKFHFFPTSDSANSWCPEEGYRKIMKDPMVTFTRLPTCVPSFAVTEVGMLFCHHKVTQWNLRTASSSYEREPLVVTGNVYLSRIGYNLIPLVSTYIYIYIYIYTYALHIMINDWFDYFD